VLDIIESIRGVMDAPPEVVLACPVGIIAALHFASDPAADIKGARSDSIVRQAKAELVQRPAWVRVVGVALGLGIAGWNYVHLQQPTFWANLLQTVQF
jgi:polyferredoxin